VLVDQDADITIKEKEFRGSEGLWILLTRKRVYKKHVTSDDLKTYKKMLLLANAHLEGYQLEGVINVSRGKKFHEIIAQFSRGPKADVSNRDYAVHGKNTKMSARALYCNPAKPSAFSTVNKLSAALPRKNKSVRYWLEEQEDYTMLKPVRKRFVRNSYTVSKLIDVWDLLDVQSLAKYNDMHKYILSVIHIFSKYQHLVHVKIKSGPSTTSVFRSLLHDDDSPRPVWVRTDQGKEFLNKQFQDMLRD